MANGLNQLQLAGQRVGSRDGLGASCHGLKDKCLHAPKGSDERVAAGFPLH